MKRRERRVELGRQKLEGVAAEVAEGTLL